jgi:hypothetical protein
MKKLLLFLVLIIGQISNSSVVYAQNEITIKVQRTAPDNRGDYLHKVANEFAKLVGDTLKSLYPATITSITVSMDESAPGITLTYSAIVSLCEKEDAIYYFDRRGALSASNDLLSAEEDAKERALEQTIVTYKKFVEQFGSPYRVWYLNAKTKTKMADYKYLYLAENFIGAGPKKF